MAHISKDAGLLLIATAMLPYSAQATDLQSKASNRLTPDMVQDIQNISQNVLAAKHSETPSPELQPLRQRVEELRKAVQYLLALPSAAAAGNISLMGASTDLSETQLSGDEQKERIKYGKLEQDVFQALEGVRQQRRKTEDSGREDLTEQRRSHMQRVSDKLKGLEDELELALESSPGERERKLDELQRRLVVSGILEQSVKDPGTPTISSIVRHRE